MARRAIAILLCLAASLLTPPSWAQQPMPAGKFDYYLLALSWSPTFCLHHRAEPGADEECDRQRGFVVHGLWPQNLDGTWPAFCLPVPPVPVALAAREAAIMPNVELIEHEWTKHGSCAGLTVDAYFAAIDRSFAALHWPDAMADPRRAAEATLAGAKRDLAMLNPGLAPDMVSFRCGRDGAVEELRVCLDRGFRFRPCGADQADSCPTGLRFPSISAKAP